MYEELYEYLEGFEKADLEEIFVQVVYQWTEQQLEAFVSRIFVLTKYDFFDNNSFFNFFANSTLAGEPYPCFGLECRMSNVDNMLRFAALYADKVLIKSPLEKHYESLDAGNKINREELAIDLLILLKLKPAVLSGIVGFYSSYLCLCSECVKKITKKEKEFQSSLESSRNHLIKLLRDSVNCNLKRDNRGYAYWEIEGADVIGFHRNTDLLIKKESKEIKKMLRKKDAVKVPFDELLSNGVVDFLISQELDDMFYAQVNTSMIDSSYLTNRISDKSLIENVLRKKSECDGNIMSIDGGLFNEIPIIGNVMLYDIINLRKKEGEAFATYRSSINSILSKENKIDKKLMKDIHKDVLLPQICQLEQTIHNNKKALANSMVQDIMLLGAGIGIGLFSGLLPVDYVSVVSVIGGIPAASDIIKKINKNVKDVDVKNNSCYFLYELKRTYEKKNK